MGRLFTWDGEHKPVPECDTDEPDTKRDADFVAKTHAELGRLSSEADAIRARMPQHPTCPDDAPCRHCIAIREAHARIDDHLEQLELAALEAMAE